MNGWGGAIGIIGILLGLMALIEVASEIEKLKDWFRLLGPIFIMLFSGVFVFLEFI